MPGIHIDNLESGMSTLRTARALLDGNFDPNVPLAHFKSLYDTMLTLLDNVVFELKEQRNTISSRDREIADLKRRLTQTGTFYP